MLLTDEDGVTTFDLFTSNRSLTPLHLELHTLLWAMTSSLQLDQLDMTFETDFLQLVKIITEGKEDDWPSLLVEFEEFHHLHSMFNSCPYVLFFVLVTARPCKRCSSLPKVLALAASSFPM